MPKKKRGSSFKSGKRKTNPKKNKPDSSESESEVLSVPQADVEESNRAARAVTPKRKISAIFSETIKKVKAVFTRRPSENQLSGNSSPTAGPSNYRGNLSRNDSDSQVVSDSECFDKEQNISIVNSSSDEFHGDAEIKTVHYDEETSDVLSITSSHGAVSSSGSDVLGDVSEKKNLITKENKINGKFLQILITHQAHWLPSVLLLLLLLPRLFHLLTFFHPHCQQVIVEKKKRQKMAMQKMPTLLVELDWVAALHSFCNGVQDKKRIHLIIVTRKISQ